MRIKITKGGIFGVPTKESPTGEIAVGTELTVKNEPAGWAGRYEVISGSTEGKTADTGDQPKTAAEVLAMATTEGVHFKTFEAEAKKLLGDKTPSGKDEIVKALEELATMS